MTSLIIGAYYALDLNKTDWDPGIKQRLGKAILRLRKVEFDKAKFDVMDIETQEKWGDTLVLDKFRWAIIKQDCKQSKEIT